MKKIVKYTVIYGRTRKDLIDHVKQRIKSGWQPFSDFSIKHYTNQSPDFYQTMVKYKPEPKNSI